MEFFNAFQLNCGSLICYYCEDERKYLYALGINKLQNKKAMSWLRYVTTSVIKSLSLQTVVWYQDELSLQGSDDRVVLLLYNFVFSRFPVDERRMRIADDVQYFLQRTDYKLEHSHRLHYFLGQLEYSQLVGMQLWQKMKLCSNSKFPYMSSFASWHTEPT
jgi:hypothetical protein